MKKNVVLMSILAISFLYLLSGLADGKLVICVLIFCAFIFSVHLFFSSMHYDGRMFIGKTVEGKKLFSLELKGDPEELESKDVIIFKVTSNQD